MNLGGFFPQKLQFDASPPTIRHKRGKTNQFIERKSNFNLFAYLKLEHIVAVSFWGCSFISSTISFKSICKSFAIVAEIFLIYLSSTDS